MTIENDRTEFAAVVSRVRTHIKLVESIAAAHGTHESAELIMSTAIVIAALAHGVEHSTDTVLDQCLQGASDALRGQPLLKNLQLQPLPEIDWNGDWTAAFVLTRSLLMGAAAVTTSRNTRLAIKILLLRLFTRHPQSEVTEQLRGLAARLAAMAALA